MTLQQLKYIIAIADYGSINEAAKRLYISQPTLSNSLKDLEAELNLSLFTRSNKGILTSVDGAEFLGYARQVIEQASLLEEKYLNFDKRKQRFSVSTQHYSFAVNAFVNLIKTYGLEEYDFRLRETQTYEIIEDVKYLRSEIGILYRNDFNGKVLEKLLKENDLVFTSLFVATPHIFVSIRNPLSKLPFVTLEDLEPYPCLSFEQGTNNSFYLSEEILSTLEHRKTIKVSDRATLFNLVLGLNGYTISSGVLDEELNGTEIVSVALKVEEDMDIGYITHKNITLSTLAHHYLDCLKELV